MKTACFLGVIFLFIQSLSKAALVIDINEPKITGQKAVIELDMKNTYSRKIEGVKGTIFLMDADGKIISQASRWIIGGEKSRPPLGPENKASYYFVLPSDRPFSKTQLMINRVVLEGGKLADPTKDVTLKESITK